MKKQYVYETEVTNKTGKIEKRVDYLKPHLCFGNATDLYLSLLKSGRYVKVNEPVLLRVEKYSD